MTPTDPLERLPPAVRRHLDAFSHEVDMIGLDVLPNYAARPLHASHDRAAANAELVAIESGREAAVGEGRRIASAYIERRFADPGSRPGLGLGEGGSTLVSGLDRARLARSFGDAIVAIILGDALDPANRDELLGPWGSLLP
jgi:hypothetical protein